MYVYTFANFTRWLRNEKTYIAYLCLNRGMRQKPSKSPCPEVDHECPEANYIVHYRVRWIFKILPCRIPTSDQYNHCECCFIF